MMRNPIQWRAERQDWADPAYDEVRRENTLILESLRGIIQDSDDVLVTPDEFHLRSGRVLQGRSSAKPKGLWYAKGLAWVEWLIAEQPDWLKPYLYRIHMDKRDVLALRTIDDILAFASRYAADAHSVRWRDVADDYAGIEIAPYRYDLRGDMRVFWYTGWDIPSGCVWEPGIILDVEEIEV